MMLMYFYYYFEGYIEGIGCVGTHVFLRGHDGIVVWLVWSTISVCWSTIRNVFISKCYLSIGSDTTTFGGTSIIVTIVTISMRDWMYLWASDVTHGFNYSIN